MALLFMEGFDNNRTPPQIVVTYGTYGRQDSFITGRVGGRAAVCRVVASSSWVEMMYTLTAPSASVTTGVALRWTNAEPAGTTTNLIQFAEGVTAHLAVRKNASGFMTVVRGDGTVLGTATVATDTSAWNHFDLTAVIHDTTGSATLRVNGAVVVTVTGVNTRNGGATGLVDSVTLKTGTMTSSPAGTLNVDDWYICDGSGPAPYNGSLGDCRIDTIRPVSTGASSQWVGSDGDSINNWAHVDDIDVTTDYVGTATVGAKDLYEMSDPSSSVNTVYAVQSEIIAWKTDAGAAPGPIQTIQRNAAGVERVETVGEPAVLSTSAQWFRGAIQTASPSGASWTPAIVNGLQSGVQVGTS